MIGRELARENRAGLPHFKPGQLNARRLEATLEEKTEPAAELYELSWVDQGGHAWLVMFDYDGGDWTPLAAWRGGQTFVREMGLPVVDARQVAALDQARNYG